MSVSMLALSAGVNLLMAAKDWIAIAAGSVLILTGIAVSFLKYSNYNANPTGDVK